jgi:hypothetical protein
MSQDLAKQPRSLLQAAQTFRMLTRFNHPAAPPDSTPIGN